MSDNDRKYTVGEVARATGLTVRTLQHYDHIGLLPPSGRTEGGRRYYVQGDLLRLTQIVFYKSVGIPLSDIRDKLPDEPTPIELETIFADQVTVLLQKMDALHMAVSILNASSDVLKMGNEPPLAMLAELIRAMEGSSIKDWVGFPFDAALAAHFEARGLVTLGGVMGLYHIMRELMVEAAALGKVNADVSSLSAQTLARRWWEEIIMSVSDGDDETMKALLAVNEARETWPEADRKLFETAEPFIEAALAVYIERNHVVVPDAMLGKAQSNE